MGPLREKPFRITKDASHSSHCFIEKNDIGIVELSLTLLTQPMVNENNYSMFENSLTLLTLVWWSCRKICSYRIWPHTPHSSPSMSKNNNHFCKQPHRAHTTPLRRKKTFRISKDASYSSHCFIKKNDKLIVELSLTLLTRRMVNEKNH